MKVIDFLKYRWIFVVFSVALMVLSVSEWMQRGEEKYGIDFRGGYEFVIRGGASLSAEAFSVDTIRAALADKQLPNAVVQAFEAGSKEFAIRIPAVQSSDALKDSVVQIVREKFGQEIELLKANFVGPTAGAELRSKALTAIIVGLIGILLYITWRFEFAFALGAVVALFHDVIFATGVYLFAGHTLSMGTVAAALTILGYSVNDTIVIFDRVREEIAKRPQAGMYAILNESLSVMLTRTIITSVLTLFSVTALLVLGGGELTELSLYLFAGIISGSYSTIFIASPVVLAWERWKGRA